MRTSEIFVDFHRTPNGPVAQLRVRPTTGNDELQAKLDSTISASVRDRLDRKFFQGQPRPKQEFIGYDGHKSQYRDIPGQYLDPVERSVLIVVVSILAGSFSVALKSDGRLSGFIAPISESEIKDNIGQFLCFRLLGLCPKPGSEPKKSETTTFQVAIPRPLQAYSEQKGRPVSII